MKTIVECGQSLSIVNCECDAWLSELVQHYFLTYVHGIDSAPHTTQLYGFVGFVSLIFGGFVDQCGV